ncbi:radical SAM protein [Verrucosispora sp. TAA-831]|uniref:radical SAM protein n=1 Tax=Verrucosispora sp. TAA-831 TaxID=3422227 RepID=UPI003D6EB925
MAADSAQTAPVGAAGPAGARAGIKTRRTALGTHVFDRRTGMNLFIDQAGTDESVALAPRQVSVALTNACDLRCSYCYAPKTPGRHDTATVVAWAKELDAHGCFGVGFGGGEPTLVTGFPEMCQLVAAQTDLAVTFTSHGHHLTASVCTRLVGAVHFIRISMDGVGQTYERLRGRPFGALLDRLADVGDVAPFGINVVVNERTVHELDQVADVATQAGARELLLLPQQPTARWHGIDQATLSEMRAWLNRYRGPLAVTIGATGIQGLPVTAPVPGEQPLDAYAHITADGVLKRSSYQAGGSPIGEDGVMAALSVLRTTGATP